MKTLYLHVGTPKTGTSAIQALCDDNSALLEKKGYCYPILPYHYLNYHIRRNGAFLHAPVFDDNGVRQREEEKRRLKEGLETVSRLFDTHDVVILSDENIWKASYSRRKTIWAELMELGEQVGFTLKVIVYLRRQDTLIDSWWNQRVKETTNQTFTCKEYFDTLVPETQLDYYTALERISAVVGKENVIVRVFERSRFPGGLIQSDFMQAIGLELTEEYTLLHETINMRLAGNTHEIKRILNTLPDMTPKQNRFFRRALAVYSDLSGENYPSSMLSVEEAKAFVDQYLEENRKVAAEYLNDPGSDLFDMTFKELPKWEKDNPHMIDDVILFAGQCNIYLLDKVNNLTEKNKKLRGEIRALEKETEALLSDLRHPLRTGCRVVKRKSKRILRTVKRKVKRS